MIALVDQLGRRVELPAAPRRIVSLVPSITELLAHYGLHDRVVGITKFCTHPNEWYRTKTRIGGTKSIDVTKIQQLRPDLIIANQEENDRAAVEALATTIPTYVSRVASLHDAEVLYEAIGRLTDTPAAARSFLVKVRQASTRLRGRYTGRRVAYLIWQDPYMVAGGDTYIHAVLHHLGLVNVFADRSRYPVVDLATCRALGAEVLLLSSEPFPFAPRHAAAMRREWGGAHYHLVDGRWFSWYGPAFLELDLRLPPALDAANQWVE